MKIEKEKFDERQLQIRGDIFKHGFLAAGALMLFNAFLHGEGIEWADGVQQNILMLILTITVVSIEFHLRGVYFGKGDRRKAFIAIFGLCSVCLLILSIIHGVQGEEFADGFRLTDNGYYIVGGIMFFINTFCALIQKKKKKQAERDN
jgi:membrane protein CcdC involved in cytochrome C biogenesis